MLTPLKQTWSRLASPTSLRARFGRGLLFSLIGAAFNSGSTLLVNVIVANWLGRQVFGEYATVQSTLLTLSSVASLANGFTAIRHVSEFRSVDKAKTGRILGLTSALSLALGGAFAFLLLAGAPWLARDILRAPHLSLGLMLASAAIFFNVNNFYQTGVLAGLESYPALAIAGVVAGTAYLIAGAVGAYGWGREGALAGLAASAAAQWLILRFFLQRECARQGLAPNYRQISEERDIFLRFAVPAALSGFSSMPALWLASAFLVRQPNGYAQMALYAAANNLRVLVLFVPQLFNNVGMVLLNNARGQGDTGRYWKVFWGNLVVTTGITLVGALTIALIGPHLLNIFGRTFAEGQPVLLVLMISTLAETLMQAVYQVVQSRGKMWLSLFVVALPRDGLIVLSAYGLTAHYGAVGLAFAYVAGWSAALLTTSIVVWRLQATR